MYPVEGVIAVDCKYVILRIQFPTIIDNQVVDGGVCSDCNSVPVAILALLADAGATPPTQVAPTSQFPDAALTNTS